MNLTQLRYVIEIVRRGLNLSAVAEALYTSQPGISKQIRALEHEIGAEIFVRRGKRLVALTGPGQRVLEIAQRIIVDAENLKRAGQDFADEDKGALTIATTHTQARYALPRAVTAFKRRYPAVQIVIHQGTPTLSCEQVLTGEADLAISTEATTLYPELASLPCYEWNRCVVVPPGHSLLKTPALTLESIAEYPIVTYDTAVAGRSLVNKAFEARGLHPNVVLTALDADVIKTYVELELGVGIMAQMAFNPMRDRGLRALDASHLFEPSTTRLAIKRGTYLRAYAYEFIALFAPPLSRKVVDEALAGGAERQSRASRRATSK
jgi:LysR family transcriptional regulator, cys regulon transcriptional activator